MLTFTNVDISNQAELQLSAFIRRDLYAGNGQHGRFEEKYPTMQDYANYLNVFAARNPTYVFWVWQNNEIVGHGIVCGSNKEWREADGYIDLIAVTPNQRGQGIGKAILQRCVELLTADFETLWLNCIKTNDANMKFYAKQGWQSGADHPKHTQFAIWEKKVA